MQNVQVDESVFEHALNLVCVSNSTVHLYGRDNMKMPEFLITCRRSVEVPLIPLSLYPIRPPALLISLLSSLPFLRALCRHRFAHLRRIGVPLGQLERRKPSVVVRFARGSMFSNGILAFQLESGRSGMRRVRGKRRTRLHMRSRMRKL